MGLEVALVAAWRLIGRGGAVPAAAAEADRLDGALPPPATRQAAALVGAFDDQLDRGALHEDLLVFLSSPARFRLVTGWARRRRGSRAGAAPAVPARPFRERCRRLVAEARPRRLAMYRAVIGAQGGHRGAKAKASAERTDR
jgi:hypothetical protein